MIAKRLNVRKKKKGPQWSNKKTAQYLVTDERWELTHNIQWLCSVLSVLLPGILQGPSHSSICSSLLHGTRSHSCTVLWPARPTHTHPHKENKVLALIQNEKKTTSTYKSSDKALWVVGKGELYYQMTHGCITAVTCLVIEHCGNVKVPLATNRCLIEPTQNFQCVSEVTTGLCLSKLISYSPLERHRHTIRPWLWVI